MPGASNTKPAAGGSAATKPAFTWGNTLPCVATYKVLEGDTLLNQFEDSSTAFDAAGTMTIGSLLFYPHAAASEDIIDVLADQMARKFLTLVQKNFTITLHPNETTGAVIDQTAAIFADSTKTLTDLAEVLNNDIDFPASNS